jgi:hypothetical protein
MWINACFIIDNKQKVKDMEWLEFKKNILDKTGDTQGLEYKSFSWFHKYGLPVAVISLGTALNDKVIKIPNLYKSVSGAKQESDFVWVKVISIKTLVFAGNENITDIILPDNIHKIEQGSFRGCKNLKRISLSKKVKFIPEGTFSGCESLEDVYYGGSEEEWKKVNIVYQELRVKEPIQLGLHTELEYVPIHGNEPLLSAHIHFNCN